MGVDAKATADLRKSMRATTTLAVRPYHTIDVLCFDKISQQSTSVPLSSNLQMQSKMLAYDSAVLELNKSRLRGASFPIVHTLLKISQEVSSDVRSPMFYS